MISKRTFLTACSVTAALVLPNAADRGVLRVAYFVQNQSGQVATLTFGQGLNGIIMQDKDCVSDETNNLGQVYQGAILVTLGAGAGNVLVVEDTN